MCGRAAARLSEHWTGIVTTATNHPAYNHQHTTTATPWRALTAKNHQVPGLLCAWHLARVHAVRSQ